MTPFRPYFGSPLAQFWHHFEPRSPPERHFGSISSPGGSLGGSRGPLGRIWVASAATLGDLWGDFGAIFGRPRASGNIFRSCWEFRWLCFARKVGQTRHELRYPAFGTQFPEIPYSSENKNGALVRGDSRCYAVNTTVFPYIIDGPLDARRRISGHALLDFPPKSFHF